PWYLVAFQVLSGLTAAVVGIMVPLVIADVTRGTGRYNLAQGAAGTATGIGAALSTVAAGYVAQSLGYATGFGGLAAIGAAGLGILYWLLPRRDRRTTAPALRGAAAALAQAWSRGRRGFPRRCARYTCRSPTCCRGAAPA